MLLPLGWFWQQSLMPSTYSVMDMGYVDFGGGPRSAHGDHQGGTSVKDLVADTQREPDVTVDLVARQGTVRLASGREIEGYTLNGKTPGPTITATEGQLVEVNLRNASVEDGVSLHWHGIDVPNAEDGVAGVTQDAVDPGRRAHLPVRRRPGRDVLVPLPPGLARPGDRRTARLVRHPSP